LNPKTSKLLEQAIGHYRAGRWTPAEALCREVLADDPNNLEALESLAAILLRSGAAAESLELFDRAIALHPNAANFARKGMALAAMGRFADAVDACRQAAALAPASPEIHTNLGNALQLAGRVDEAIAAYQRALSLRPGHLDARINLGEAYKSVGQFDRAVEELGRVLRANPNSFEALVNLGGALQARGDLDEAADAFERAIAIRSDGVVAYANLAIVHKDAGRLDRAIECHDRAYRIRPEAHLAPGRLFLLQYHPAFDAQTICDEHRNWYRRDVKPRIVPAANHPNDHTPARKLRIGYVSPDFRDHPVARNLLPLLMHHDHRRFEIFCYSNTFRHDAITHRIRDSVDVWRDIRSLDDDQAAALVGADRIDMLVDLALHTSQNRLLLFARKPAPVQVTFAGYPGTTGVEAIDYRFTDPYIDPCNENRDRLYVEDSWRLPETFWCYDPIERDLPVNSLPATANGFVTFGCLNNFCKVNDDVLDLWAEVLRRTSGSRLLMVSKRGKHRGRTIDFLADRGIERRQIEFIDPLPRVDYLRCYHRIDLGLDTFPYNGHTTSLDSYWMGVPVVTLVGNTVVGRAGSSQLSNLNLRELAADGREQFVKVAVELARDWPRLSELRRTLRHRMEGSPLMDGERFAAGVETAFGQMWERWCASPR
jgi:predicted O-linked N-acetylglucosamine transferase (SPINDLY family)